MKVTIDPTVKQLFFDRIIEHHSGDKYDTMKWVESIAYGEKKLIISDNDTAANTQLKVLVRKMHEYKRLWESGNKLIQDLKNKNWEQSRKTMGIDEEIESYIDEIKYYREILESKGLQDYLVDYDDEGW